MPSPIYKRFDIYWWDASTGPELVRFCTRDANDIEQFSNTHFLIRARPLIHGEDEIKLILRQINGSWVYKSDSFEDITMDYPIACASTTHGQVWTDAQNSDVFVIRGIL